MLEHRDNILRRFKLTDGQFFAHYRYKNLQWFLDGRRIGYGDLTDDQILYISERLNQDQEFVGWNEHHGGPNQQTNSPMIRITSSDIKFREDIVATEGR